MLNSIKNHLELNIISNKTVVSNLLDANNCLFTPVLLAMLLRSYKDKFTYFKHSSNNRRKILKHKEGMYLVAFRILNKEKRSLVYNYIYYNDLLYLTLIVYSMVINYFITRDNHEWGKYLVVLDNVFLDYNTVSKYIDLYNTKDKVRYKS